MLVLDAYIRKKANLPAGRIAVVLAVFNGEEWLRSQLDSIAAQTHLPDAIFIADDGSSDGSTKIINEFSVTSIVHCHVLNGLPRLGVTRNFERLLYAASGYDYIFLSDQDDEWFPSKIEQMLECFDDTGAGLLVCDAIIIDAEGNDIGETWLERLRGHGLSMRAHGLGCASALTGKLLRAALPIPKGKAHDTWLHYVADKLGLRYVLVETLMQYRVHSRGASKSIDKQIPDSYSGARHRKSRSLFARIYRNIPLIPLHIRMRLGLIKTFIRYKQS